MRGRLTSNLRATKRLLENHNSLYCIAGLGSLVIFDSAINSLSSPRDDSHSLTVALRPSIITDRASSFRMFEGSQEKPFNALSEFLEDGTHRPNSFIVKLDRLAPYLNEEQIKSLASKAINNGHAVELGNLVEKFDTIIDKEFIEQALLNQKDSSIFRELLVANADEKIAALDYLFDPKNHLVIVEEDDKDSICRIIATPRNKEAKAIVVNSEKYDCSHVMIPSNQLWLSALESSGLAAYDSQMNTLPKCKLRN